MTGGNTNLTRVTDGSKRKIVFLSGLLVITYVSFINMFPNGYVFVGNDVVQYINLKSTFGNLFYAWTPMIGTGAFLQYFSYSLFYLPFYLLSLLCVSASAQSFFYFFIFLGSSYVSFFLSTKAFTRVQVNRAFELRILLSLIYAINPYTLYVFIYTWGYSPFLFLYPIVPAIFSFTYSYFSDSKIFSKNLIVLGVVFFLSNIAFGNFAFFVSLILFLALFVMLLYLLHFGAGKIVYKAIVYSSVLLASTFWTTATSIAGMMYSFSTMTAPGHVFNLGNWILYQRIPILPQFFLFPNLEYFIATFPILFIIGAIGLLTLLVISLKKIRKMSLVFLVLTLVSIFITAKGEGLISDEMTLKIFTLPIMNTLRSYDKTLVFLPFFFVIIIYIGTQDFYKKEHARVSPTNSISRFDKFRLHQRKIILVSFFLILLGVSPFFLGGIQTRYSYSIDSGKNYQTSTYSYLVHIPNDYFDAAKIISQDPKQDRILDLPYSVINSPGWVNYPKWKVVGADPTEQLFSKPSVKANDASFTFGAEWNSANVDNSTWIVKLMSLYNVQYLIYHKDVDDKFIDQTRDKIDFLQKEGYITLINSYDNFDLYNLSDTYFRPHIYPSSNIVLVSGSSDELLSSIISDNLTANNVFFLSSQITNEQWQSLVNYNENYESNEKAGATTPQIVFQEINPTKYQVKIENATQPFFLVFSESYDPEWKAYIENSGTGFGNIIANYGNVGVEEANSTTSFTPGDIHYLFDKSLPDNDHYIVNGYANAWYIDPAEIAKDQNGSFEITLFYQPQSFYYLGIIISGVTFTACIIYIATQTTSFKSIHSVLRRRKAYN